MENLTEASSVLFSRLPQINNINEMIEVSCSLLNASAYIVNNSGHIIGHSDKKNVVCESWLNAVQQGQLSELHKKSVLTPQINCNVIRDKTCKGDPCARLSIPIKISEDMLPGAVVFFLWDNDPTIEKQTTACILAGAISNLLIKGKKEDTDEREESVRLLKELLNYKPGLNLHFTNALKYSAFAGKTGSYNLCLLTSDDSNTSPYIYLEKINAISDRLWVFEHLGQILILYNTKELSSEDFRQMIEPLINEYSLKACCSIDFDDLLKLRYIYEDTQTSFENARLKDTDTRYFDSMDYLSSVFLSRCKHLMNVKDSFPLFFRRLIEHDERTGKDYMKTLSTYLDSGRNTNAAAKQSFMHRNTMVQQLERIEQIMGVSLEDSEMCFFLQLCIRMYQMEKI